jgi:hypothetical protein
MSFISELGGEAVNQATPDAACRGSDPGFTAFSGWF